MRPSAAAAAVVIVADRAFCCVHGLDAGRLTQRSETRECAGHHRLYIHRPARGPSVSLLSVMSVRGSRESLRSSLRLLYERDRADGSARHGRLVFIPACPLLIAVKAGEAASFLLAITLERTASSRLMSLRRYTRHREED